MDDIKIRISLEGSDQVQAGGQKAAEGLKRVGQTGQQAGQQLQLSGQQMAQVSAQLQDLFVQIQGGQAPLTALLQQGSQLSAQFGGVGNAFRAIASLVSPTVAVLGTAAAAVGTLAVAYNQGANEAQAYTRSLVLSGNAAGTTVGQIKALAAAQAQVVGTQGDAAAALAALAASGKVSAGSLAEAAEAATRLARVGIPLEETAKKFASLGKEPLKAIIELNEAENFLTESVYRQIKALDGQGRAAEAAALAQSTYAEVGKQRAQELAENLGTLERAWVSLKDVAKDAWDKMLNVGREDGPQQKLAAVEAQIRDAEAKIAAARNGGYANRPFIDAERVARAQEQLLAGLKTEAAALQENIRLAQRSADAKKAQVEGTKALIKADEDAAKAAKAANAERDREAAALERAVGLSGNYQQTLTELYKLREKGKLTEEQYVAAVQKLITTQPVIREQLQAQAEVERQVAEAQQRGVELYERKIDALNQSAEAVAKQVQKLRDEEAAIALAAAQNLSLAEAIELVTANRLEEQRAKALAANDTATAAALQREIDKRRELATLMGSKDARDVAKKAADDAAREWQRASSDIERTITDALMRGFESGKGFAQTLRDTLVNTFRTLVLRPTIQALVQPLAVGLLGTSAGTAAAGTAGGALNAASGLGAAGGMLGLFGAGGLSGALMGGAGWLTGATTLGGSLGAAGSLIGTGTVAGATSGLAMGLGAIAPIAGAAAVIANALGLFRSTEYKGTSIRGTLGMGDIADYAVTRRGGSLFSGPKWSENFAGRNAASDAIQAAYSSVREATAAMAEQLGLSGAAIRQFTQSIYIDGNGKSADQVQKELSDALNGANDSLARFALGTTAYSRAGETAAQTLERLAGSLTGVNGVLGVLGQSLVSVSVAGGDAASQLLAQFGGLQQFQQAGAQYLQDYYSEAERTALATQQLTAQLGSVGLALPASRDAYRQLVEAQDLNTESGRKAYAALLQLAPSFAQLVPAITDVGSAAAEAARLAEEAAARQAEAGRRVLADLAQQQGELQVELLRAQGNTAGAAELARQQALARLTEGLSAQDAAAATAAYDFADALREQIAALNDAAAAAQEAAQAEQQRIAAVANERFGLETQLLQLQGDTAALRARELAALDPTNRAIQERINALADEQAEQQRLAGIASERSGLETQLLQLQGDTAALRARELATLDPSNRALQELINSLTDQQAATAAAAAAARDAAAAEAAITSERSGLETRLLQVQGDTAALRARELAALDPSNRTLLERIFAIEDERTAQQAAAQAAAEAARAAEEQARAAERVREAWRSIGDTLLEEAQRILGVDASVSSMSAAQAQARFAIATGQARAGDEQAAKALPELTRTLLALVGNTASTRAELDLARAQVAASLQGTAAVLGGAFGFQPRAAGGAVDVPALLSQISATAPLVNAGAAQQQSAAAAQSDLAALVSEVRALRTQVQELQALSQRSTAAGERTRDVLVNVTEGGRAMQTETAS